ncbi:kinetochore complex Fta4 of Sim4 subunit, or CENP-50-domain-containing protein [Talaromyces proteolyticus]|uniref:Kinetochore complex Fta4 of Sim4 subunit, or CENP-50-domain-containing protein n=1 Tax=Talaromyces proteolyticus TaxID=1131652 RepID=A0AAD4KSN0_9EURO|nr:kinetochore complex Fta4 of Sim4 subunit, or CENP-50-domain-containing protein [Talaromyces proteolyticus]KAH8698438.1 kinetochore complex Fta4 of Sim4 subunit, or CENP-50-domain-containing protein [Talaromyces proteolyticus]
MENLRTISELKASFIRNQVRILSASLSPQEGWRDYAPETEDNLSEKVVEEALLKFNAILKQHNRVVYSNQAIQHIARQIENLYWESVKREAVAPTKELSGVELGSDVSNHQVIEKLPAQYHGEDISAGDQERYKAIYQRLLALDSQRQEQQKRLAHYRQLEALLEPFKNPQQNIQPNLVTRDGELVQEIDKMRMLIARVSERVHNSRVTQPDHPASSTDPNEKLAALLGSWDLLVQEHIPREIRRAKGLRIARRQKIADSDVCLTGSGIVFSNIDGNFVFNTVSDQRSQHEQAEAVQAASLPSRPVSRSFAVFAQDDLALESMTTNGTAMGSFMDNSPNVNMANMARQSPSPVPQHGVPQVNGGGAVGSSMMAGLPMNAGHQMDLNNLYEMVVEFSDIIKHNREMTRGIVASAEEIMRRSTVEGVSPEIQQVSGEISAARIAELERALAKERHTVEILKREQIENTKLIGEFESAMGIIVEQIRTYCQNNNLYFLAQKKDYNSLLQAERDAHLASRLDRDHWHSQTMRLAEMLRTAYRLRCEEDEAPTRVVQGLQSEVRALRSAIGLEPEKPEAEMGWEFLKDTPSAD